MIRRERQELEAACVALLMRAYERASPEDQPPIRKAILALVKAAAPDLPIPEVERRSPEAKPKREAKSKRKGKS